MTDSNKAAPAAAQPEPPRFRWDQDDDAYGVMVGPVPDGEWVRWRDVAPPTAQDDARDALTDGRMSGDQCRRLLYGFALDCNHVGPEQAAQNLIRGMKRAAMSGKEQKK